MALPLKDGSKRTCDTTLIPSVLSKVRAAERASPMLAERAPRRVSNRAQKPPTQSVYQDLHADFDRPWGLNSPMRPGYEAALHRLASKDPFALIEFDSEELWPIDGEDDSLKLSLGPWPAGSGDGGHLDADMAVTCESSKVVGWIPNVGCSALYDDIFTKPVEDEFLIPHQNAGSSLPDAV